jgi:polar amino acid transport system substrate-binding protein
MERRSERSWSRAAVAAVAVAMAAVLSGCQFPRDPDGTLDRASGGTIRVGVGQRMPWAGWQGDRPVGVEVDLVTELANRLHARVEWCRGSDEELLEALQKRALDIVAAGLDDRSAWKTKVSFTRFFFRTRTVLAVAPGVPAPHRLHDTAVAAEPDGAEAALLREHGAHVVPEDRRDVARLVEDWQLGPDLRSTGLKLEDAKHVLALPLGENAWLLRINRMLVGSSPRTRSLLRHLEADGGAGG